MKKILLALFIFSLTGCGYKSWIRQQWSAERIFKDNKKAVVVVVAYDKYGKPISHGTGFIVRQDGAVITNYHVISNAADIQIKAGDKVLKVEGFIYSDKENDMVIIKAKGENFPIVKLGDITNAVIGDKVYMISSPHGLQNAMYDGILIGVKDIDPKRKILQITAPVSSGSSGGPVFNEDGEVIGVATFIIEEAQNINFALPVEILKDRVGDKKVTALKDAAITDYKKSAGYWFYLGYYYGESGLHSQEIEAYKQAARINPDDAKVYYNLGITYDNLGMFREAIEAYKQAARINPDDAKAYYNLGVIYDDLGVYREAIEAYKQAIRINPYDAKAYYNLGVTYNNLGMRREAIEAYKQAIRINPDYAKAHYNLGIFHLILNDRAAALEEYKILKTLNPEFANELFNLIYK